MDAERQLTFSNGARVYQPLSPQELEAGVDLLPREPRDRERRTQPRVMPVVRLHKRHSPIVELSFAFGEALESPFH